MPLNIGIWKVVASQFWICPRSNQNETIIFVLKFLLKDIDDNEVDIVTA